MEANREQNMSENAQARERAAAAARERRRLANLSDEARLAARAANTARQRRRRANLSDEAREAYRAAHAARERLRRANLSAEALEADRAVHAARQRRRRANLPEEVLEADRAVHAARERRRRANLPTEALEADRAARAERQRRRRAKLANEACEIYYTAVRSVFSAESVHPHSCDDPLRVQKQKEHQQQLDSKQGLVLNDGASTSGQYPTTNPLHLDVKLEDTEVDIKDDITSGITNFNESITIKSEDDSHAFDGADDGHNINENDFSITDDNNQNVSTTSTSSQGTDLRSFITVIPQARESIMLGSVSSDAPVRPPPEKRRAVRTAAPVRPPPEKRRAVRTAESTSTSRKSDPKELHVPTNDLCVLCAKDISKIRRRFSVAQYSDIILLLTGFNVLDYEIPPNSCCSCFRAVANIKEFQVQVHEATDLLKRKLAVYAEKQFEFANVTPNFGDEPHLTAALMFDQEYCETPDVNMQEMQDRTIVNAATLHASAVAPVVSTLEPPPLIFKAVFPFTKCDICGKLYKDLVNHNCQGKDVAEQSANVDVPLVTQENTRLMKVAADDVLKQRKKYKSSCTPNMRAYLSSTTQCKICGNQVRVPSLRFHMLNHRKTDEKAICSVCGKMYAKLGGLKKHEVVHGEKRHKCAICGQCFHYSKYLQRHLRSHSGEKPFACPYCDKTFSILWNLNQHKRLHTNDKPYKCQLCSASFRHNVTLKHHLSTSHTADEIAGSVHKSSASPNASGKSATDTSNKAENCDNDNSVVSNTESQEEDNCDENVK